MIIERIRVNIQLKLQLEFGCSCLCGGDSEVHLSSCQVAEHDFSTPSSLGSFCHALRILRANQHYCRLNGCYYCFPYNNVWHPKCGGFTRGADKLYKTLQDIFDIAVVDQEKHLPIVLCGL
ncbi:hypothetical protein POM88_006752 [Heracleum sosnowskyi]|uniref:Uncharacterized protein n=1 Tax=Heracleum sosnowskyi TaxID=360622 RepID=A0AAD8N512_9APIA|nr:hypothetical protein POM88_006752 [Heracleum sosnowskyi]